MTVLAIILTAAGAIFLLVSSLGLLRLPDFYTRAHAVGKSETLGVMLVFGGLALYNGFQLTSVKLLLILLFVAIANPTATHVICRAARLAGLEIWTRKGKPEAQ